MPKFSYIYGTPLTSKRLAAALGIAETAVDTCQTEEDGAKFKFTVALTPEQEKKLAELAKPYSLIRKGEEA